MHNVRRKKIFCEVMLYGTGNEYQIRMEVSLKVFMFGLRKLKYT